MHWLWGVGGIFIGLFLPLCLSTKDIPLEQVKIFISLSLPISIFYATTILNKKTTKETKRREILIEVVSKIEKQHIEFMLYLRNFLIEPQFNQANKRMITLSFKAIEQSLEVIKANITLTLPKELQIKFSQMNSILTNDWENESKFILNDKDTGDKQFSEKDKAILKKIDDEITLQLIQLKIKLLYVKDSQLRHSNIIDT